MTRGDIAQVALLSGDATVHQAFRMNSDLCLSSAAQDDAESEDGAEDDGGCQRGITCH